MGKKYIIEIEDEPFGRDDDMEHYLFRAKGFESLVFDMEGLNKLEQFEENKYDFDEVYDEAYKNGLDAAWNAARAIELSVDDGGLDIQEIRHIFGDMPPNDVVKKFNPEDVVNKLNEYNMEINVGDEVRLIHSTGIVTRKYYDSGVHYNVVWSSGSTGFYGESDLKKTGRRFPEIAEVLKKMRE